MLLRIILLNSDNFNTFYTLSVTTTHRNNHPDSQLLRQPPRQPTTQTANYSGRQPTTQTPNYSGSQLLRHPTTQTATKTANYSDSQLLRQPTTQTATQTANHSDSDGQLPACPTLTYLTRKPNFEQDKPPGQRKTPPVNQINTKHYW